MSPNPVYVEFGKLVRGYRKRSNLTQDELAERVGLSRTSITNIEQGRQKVLLHHVFLLAESLGVGPGALLPSARTHPVPELEQKIPENLTGAEKNWIRRVMASSANERGDEHGKDRGAGTADAARARN
jgi:transcriptional regulator with XRE-family HTH domain